MHRRLLLEIHEYFANIPNPAREEQDLLTRITGELPFFHITSVHRDDLLNVGLDGLQATDEQMEKIADRMHEDYCEQLFRGSLEIIAEFAGVPEKITGDYVLVAFPEDASHFEENGIGYPCHKSGDNGARFVRTEDYIDHFDHKPDGNRYYAVVEWPESQELMEKPGYEEYSEEVMDEKGLADFICPAFWVPLCFRK
jgi:hypothetical protein